MHQNIHINTMLDMIEYNRAFVSNLNMGIAMKLHNQLMNPDVDLTMANRNNELMVLYTRLAAICADATMDELTIIKDIIRIMEQ